MTTRTLERPPRMLPLYLRAAVPALPGAGRLPGVAGGGGDLPDLELRLDAVEVERDHLTAYSEVCGFTPGATLPVTYPHVLAFPLHMALMTDARFPFGAVGLVHLENRIEQRRPLRPFERLAFRVRATGLEPHPKGRTFAIVTEVRVGDELVWEERSTMLRRGPGGGRAPGGEGAVPPTGGTRWQVPGDTGRRYASASGDRNPIHMHPLTAKAFGFPRAIAHGMWAKARCLAELEHELPEAFAVETSFRKPILLPAEVAFGSERGGGRIRFALRSVDGGALHLSGAVTPEEAGA